MAEKSLSHKKEKPPIMKSPSSRQETKTLKRKLFSSLSSLPENEDKKTIKHPPSKKRRPSSRPTSPPVPASTPPSRGGNSGRLIPLSERQQLAMLMQMTSEEHSPESTSKQSPQTPTGVRKTSIMTTPTFGLTSSAIKAKVNKRNEKGETQLHIAAIKGDIISTKALIKQGADVNCQDFAGWTPLHEACNHGFYDVARQLLEAGANVNIQGFNDITPLHDAAVNGHVKVVELLLKHGADPLQANNLGQTPMTIARSPSILQLLKNEIISSSSDVSTPEVRSPTSPESSCSNEDGLQVKKDIGAPEFVEKTTAIGSNNSEHMLRQHDSWERSPNRFRMKEAKNVQDDIRMDVSFFTLQSTSSEEELFNPNLPSLMKENVEVLKPQQLFDDLKKLSNNNIDGEDKKHVDSSSDSDSSDSSDSESTKSGNGDHLSSSDSSISSDSDSSKETEDKVMKDLTQEESAQERNIFSTMQQTASPPKPSPGKNVVTTYSIKPPSSVDNQIQSLQANVRIVPKITIRLPQLSPKRDERKRSRDEESERPNKETGRHSSPQRSVTGQDKAFDKFVFSETDKKQVMDGPPRDTLRLLKTDEKGGQPIKNSVTSSNPVSCVNDASEIRTLLLKPRETGRTREIASPAASTGSEVTTNNRRRYNKNNDHELATVTSSQNSSARTVSCLGVTGKMTTRSSSALEGIITRSSSGRNSPKVSIDSSTHSNKSDKAEKASSKESSPARSDKSQTGNINFEISQTNSGKSSPKTMPESASSGSERSSPKRVSDSFVPTVGKLTIKVGVAENIIQSSNQAGKSSPKTNNGVSTGVSKTDELSEKPVRVTRTLRSNSHAHAHAQAQANSGSENSNQEKEKETINVPLTRSRRNQVEATTTTPSEPAPPPPVVESHPRKRKMARHREQNNDESVLEPPVRLAPEQRTNSFEMFLNIRQIVAERHKSLCPVTSKAPQGFKQYLTFRKNYVLDNSDHSKRKAVPQHAPPDNLPHLLLEAFHEQERLRHRLRTRHFIEREKLVLSAEQEIMRVHGNAARASANQSTPYSVCSILRDQEIYNMPDLQGEEDAKNIRTRFNGRQFFSWLRDVDDKYAKLKEELIQRQEHEIASLYAVQKMEWECKLKDLRLYDGKNPPLVSKDHVPIVEIKKEFDLLPA